jgi:hypothetical protein
VRIASWLVLAVDGDVPSSDRTYAVLLGIAAVITAIASPLVAYFVGRRKASEDEVPRLRRDIKRLTRDVEDLQTDVLNLSRHSFAVEAVAYAKGATAAEIPPRPVLRIARARPDEETG